MVKIPDTRGYRERFLQYDHIASSMAVRTFGGIERCLHCNDNRKMGENCSDKLLKIHPLINALKKRLNLLMSK